MPSASRELAIATMSAESAPPSLELGPLNAPQAEAVAHAHGPLIVFAGAGSGKTRVITYRIANLVATHAVPPYRVLAVTFTNKAAGEMRDRLEHLLGSAITRELWIGTFHAVCVRLIRRYHESIGISPNFVIYDDSDQKAVMKRVLRELDLDERRIAPQKVLGRIEREKQEARGPAEMDLDDWQAEITQRCYEAYQRHLREANAVDFADLLLLVLRLVEREEDEAARHLRGRFAHVLVDEFQDVNLVQYRLVRALAAERRNICVVGDDDQSIYRWRGADVRNIRNFTSDFPDARLVKLEQNYRSTANVVGAALGVIRWAADRQPKELWTANPAGSPVRIVHCANERDEAAWVVAEVKRRVAAGTSPRDIAIFYRVHAQSRVLEEVMRHENVPYQIVGGTKFFDRAEIKDAMSYLRVISNPQSDVDLVRIINKPTRKIGSKTIEKLTAVANLERCSLWDAIEPLCASNALGAAAQKSLRALVVLMKELMEAAATGSPHEIASEVMTKSGYADWLREQDNAEADARLDNLHELLGSIAEYEEEVAYAEEKATLSDYLTRVSLVSDADTMQEVPRVPMMTVHAAKGLEFDAVFLTGMEERLFPLRGQEPGEEDQLEEERRLAYVAVTRARHELAITHTNTRMIYGQVRYNAPSRFLADVPPAHQERVATPALGALSRDYTLSRGAEAPGFRELIRAGRIDLDRAPAPRRQPAPVAASPGERYVERDVHLDVDHVDDHFDDDLDGFSLRVGMQVRHGKFGTGEVKAIGGGSNPSVTVKFPGWGLKTIKLTYLAPA